MLEALPSHLEAQPEPLKQALIELVRIPSVCDESADGFPFGEAVDRALWKTLHIAGDLGFRVTYGPGGYYGFAETGAGKDMLGILGHLDVVPPGKLGDWDHDPFDPFEEDAMIYGRGTQDDKGPLLASLFAAKALMDAGVKFHKRVRFIFGTDEESIWRCIKSYVEKEEIPAFGFSPDSRFPVTYAEKGVLQLQLEGSNESGIHIRGGSAFNAVPDSIVYNGKCQDELVDELERLGFKDERSEGGIEVKGKTAHAMIPEKGINTIARLCIRLNGIGIQSKAINFVAQEIEQDPNATRIFGECVDEPSGKLKFNIGKIDLGQTEQLFIDTRIPVTASKDEIVKALTATAGRYELEYKELDRLASIDLPLDHFMVTTLMNVYRKHSGDLVAGPRSSGGATYARAIPNCVAIGALTVDESLTEHQPNVRAVITNLYKAMEIYAHAVFELTR